MLPVLFKLGPLTVYSYGFFLVVAYVAAAFIFWKEGRRQGYQEERILDLSLVALFGSLVGGRLIFVLTNFEFFRSDIITSFYFWQGGFSFYGALFGALIFGSIAVNKWKWEPFQIADIASLSTLAGYFFLKVGAFLSGVEYGVKTSIPWAVTFPEVAGSRHPVQIYEALAALLVFILLKNVYEKNIRSENFRSGRVFFYAAVAVALIRLTAAFFRADTEFIFGIRTDQIVSILVAIVAISALYYFRLRDLKYDLDHFLKGLFSINSRTLRRLKFW